MKKGAESKTKTRMAIVLGIIAILTVAWTLMPNRQSAPEPTQPAASPAKAAKENEPKARESIDPRLRLDLLANSEQVKYEGKGTNIFRVGAEPVYIAQPTVNPLRNKGLEATNVHTPPPPPPINLKFFGISNTKGEKPKAFLSQGDDVWIAREGDVVNRHYKIVRILPNAVEVEDLLNNNHQNIPLTQG